MTPDPFRDDSIIAGKCFAIVRLNLATLEEEILIGHLNQSGNEDGVGRGEVK